jgi:23S rRNA (cytosine1962-C5)-methyltransferase
MLETGQESSIAPLVLKKNEERRLRAGHLWVFSNEVDTGKTALDQFEPGQLVAVQASNKRFLGYATINPHSLICARLLSRDQNIVPDRSLLVHRIKVALGLRQRLYEQPGYRLLYGESDALPGLVVDRYDDVLVVQITTAGMERMRDDIVAALAKVLKPSVIYLRNDSPVREMEGLERYTECALGTEPASLTVFENGMRFEAPLSGGQKTGWFYDHRDNRARLQRYVGGKRVLDMFSYLGGWGIQAAAGGAEQVVCSDASMPALEQLEQNAMLNNVQERVTAMQGDAFDVLRHLRDEREQFDVVVLDPPAFIKRRKDLKKGQEAYRRINELAMRVLSRDGILVSASCSHHMSRDMLQRVLLQSSRHIDRQMAILEQGGQGPDHPVHPAIHETDYLKAIFCRVYR